MSTNGQPTTSPISTAAGAAGPAPEPAQADLARNALVDISSEMVQIYKEQFGRGPTRVRTEFAAFDVRAVRLAGKTVVRVSGDLDIATAPELQRVAICVLPTVPRELRIDLARVPFLDSSGLRALLHVARAAAQLDRRVVIVRAGAQIRRLFDIAGASPHFDFKD